MTPRAPARRHVARWTAIGCTVHVETRRAGDLDRARVLVAQVLADVDEVASRFRDDSDLSRVNRSPGTWVRVDPLLVVAVRVAVDAAAATDGLVHPLLGRRLVELGYDRTYRTLRPVARPSLPTMTPTTPMTPTTLPALDAWRDIDLSEDAIRIPADGALDLGATGKAWCTDLAVTALERHLDGPAVVSIGGDLRTAGDEAWEVGVSERPDVLADTMLVLTGALATSTTVARRWLAAEAEQHHLIDPRTGRPSTGIWRTATVAAGSCVAANTAATAAVVGGRLPSSPVDDRVLPARLVAVDGSIHHRGAWPAPEPSPTPGGHR